MSSPLVVTQLTKCYGSLRALDKLSFSLEEGEIFGLLGPNGAGKTTTLSIIAGTENATAGKAEVFGLDVVKRPVEIKRLMGIVPQELVSNGFFTVLEVLRYLSGFFGIWDNEEWIAFLLQKLGLQEHCHKPCSQLSGGMKRRLMIAKALLHRPKLLFLDEPTAGVDVDLRQALWDLILALHEEGTTILLTTHYLEEAEKLCHRIGVIGAGRLLCLDTTQSLIERLTHRKIHLVLKKQKQPLQSPYLVEQRGVNNTLDVP